MNVVELNPVKAPKPFNCQAAEDAAMIINKALAIQGLLSSGDCCLIFSTTGSVFLIETLKTVQDFLSKNTLINSPGLIWTVSDLAIDETGIELVLSLGHCTQEFQHVALKVGIYVDGQVGDVESESGSTNVYPYLMHLSTGTTVPTKSRFTPGILSSMSKWILKYADGQDNFSYTYSNDNLNWVGYGYDLDISSSYNAYNNVIRRISIALPTGL